MADEPFTFSCPKCSATFTESITLRSHVKHCSRKKRRIPVVNLDDEDNDVSSETVMSVENKQGVGRSEQSEPVKSMAELASSHNERTGGITNETVTSVKKKQVIKRSEQSEPVKSKTKLASKHCERTGGTTNDTVRSAKNKPDVRRSERPTSVKSKSVKPKRKHQPKRNERTDQQQIDSRTKQEEQVRNEIFELIDDSCAELKRSKQTPPSARQKNMKQRSAPTSSHTLNSDLPFIATGLSEQPSSAAQSSPTKGKTTDKADCFVVIGKGGKIYSLEPNKNDNSSEQSWKISIADRKQDGYSIETRLLEPSDVLKFQQQPSKPAKRNGSVLDNSDILDLLSKPAKSVRIEHKTITEGKTSANRVESSTKISPPAAKRKPASPPLPISATTKPAPAAVEPRSNSDQMLPQQTQPLHNVPSGGTRNICTPSIARKSLIPAGTTPGPGTLPERPVPPYPRVQATSRLLTKLPDPDVTGEGEEDEDEPIGSLKKSSESATKIVSKLGKGLKGPLAITSASALFPPQPLPGTTLLVAMASAPTANDVNNNQHAQQPRKTESPSQTTAAHQGNRQVSVDNVQQKVMPKTADPVKTSLQRATDDDDDDWDAPPVLEPNVPKPPEAEESKWNDTAMSTEDKRESDVPKQGQVFEVKLQSVQQHFTKMVEQQSNPEKRTFMCAYCGRVFPTAEIRSLHFKTNCTGRNSYLIPSRKMHNPQPMPVVRMWSHNTERAAMSNGAKPIIDVSQFRRVRDVVLQVAPKPNVVTPQFPYDGSTRLRPVSQHTAEPIVPSPSLSAANHAVRRIPSVLKRRKQQPSVCDSSLNTTGSSTNTTVSSASNSPTSRRNEGTIDSTFVRQHHHEAVTQAAPMQSKSEPGALTTVPLLRARPSQKRDDTLLDRLVPCAIMNTDRFKMLNDRLIQL